MDLLGSIMSSMDKPPTTTTPEERKRMKERKLQMQKWKETEDKRISDFKKKIRSKIEEFMKDSKLVKLKLEPMANTDRAIVREMSDDAGLVSFSFGQEEVDRHVVMWKKEYAPSDDELAVLRRGEEWTDEVAQAIKSKREAVELEKSKVTTDKTPANLPKTDYHAKYNHLISMDVGKEAAKNVTSKNQYGNVRVENKKDRRTIEETMADRRAKKLKAGGATDDSKPSSSATELQNDS